MEFHSRAGASVSIHLERVSGYFSNFFSKGSATLESGSITGHFNPDNQDRRSQDIWDLGPDNWKSLSLRKKDNNLEIRILLELCFQDFFNSKLIFLKSTATSGAGPCSVCRHSCSSCELCKSTPRVWGCSPSISCTPGPFPLPTAQEPGPQQRQLLSKFTNDLYIKYAV